MQKFIDQHVKSGSDELKWYPRDRKYDTRLDKNGKWEITIYDKKGKTQTVPLYEYNSGMGLYYFVLTKQMISEPVMVQDFFC